MTIRDTVAQYVSGARYQGFPDRVIARAKELILDSVGCALGATLTEFSRPYLRLAEGLGGRPEATVAGGGMQISSAFAANINTQLANLLDYDDTFEYYPPAHPGCQIVQSALAVGEALGCTGQELLTAVVLAYEVSLRLGLAEGSVLWRSDSWSLANPVGPAVAAARLLHLDFHQVREMLGILQGESGLSARLPVRAKLDVSGAADIGRASIKGNYGMASLQGILAAQQARNGVGGFAGALDTTPMEWYLAGMPADGYAELTRGLGETYRILDVSLKPTPSCRWTHLPITAVWEALQGETLTANQVSKVIVRGVNRLERYDCETLLDVQMSVPCAVALAITGTPSGPAWYSPERFKAPDIRALARRVAFEDDPAAEALEITSGKTMSTVEIWLADGRVKRASVTRIKGAPDNPMTPEEQRTKFAANAGARDEKWVSWALDAGANLEHVADIRPVVRQLYAPD